MTATGMPGVRRRDGRGGPWPSSRRCWAWSTTAVAQRTRWRCSSMISQWADPASLHGAAQADALGCTSCRFWWSGPTGRRPGRRGRPALPEPGVWDDPHRAGAGTAEPARRVGPAGPACAAVSPVRRLRRTGPRARRGTRSTSRSWPPPCCARGPIEVHRRDGGVHRGASARRRLAPCRPLTDTDHTPAALICAMRCCRRCAVAAVLRSRLHGHRSRHGPGPAGCTNCSSSSRRPRRPEFCSDCRRPAGLPPRPRPARPVRRRCRARPAPCCTSRTAQALAGRREQHPNGSPSTCSPRRPDGRGVPDHLARTAPRPQLTARAPVSGHPADRPRH